MRKIIYIISCLLLITSCKDETETLSIRDFVEINRYYNSEIFQEKDLKIYGKWEALYSYGGIGGTRIEPSFDFLEIAKYGIYGIINNDDIIEIGKIEVISEDNNVIRLIKDEEYSSDLYFPDLQVLFNGNDTLMLAVYGMYDGFTAYYKRIE